MRKSHLAGLGLVGLVVAAELRRRRTLAAVFALAAVFVQQHRNH